MENKNNKQKFKVGDEVCVRFRLEKNNTNSGYPIGGRLGGLGYHTFTENGKFYLQDNELTLEHYNSSIYPKWMMVCDDENGIRRKRYVVCEFNGKYLAIKNAEDEFNLSMNTEAIVWELAYDLSKPDPKQIRIEEYKAKLDELKAEFIDIVKDL